MAVDRSETHLSSFIISVSSSADVLMGTVTEPDGPSWSFLLQAFSLPDFTSPDKGWPVLGLIFWNLC